MRPQEGRGLAVVVVVEEEVVVGEGVLLTMPTDNINLCLPLSTLTCESQTAVGPPLVSTPTNSRASQEPILARTLLCTILVLRGCIIMVSLCRVLITPTLCHITGATIIHLLQLRLPLVSRSLESTCSSSNTTTISSNNNSIGRQPPRRKCLVITRSCSIHISVVTLQSRHSRAAY